MKKVFRRSIFKGNYIASRNYMKIKDKMKTNIIKSETIEDLNRYKIAGLDEISIETWKTASEKNKKKYVSKSMVLKDFNGSKIILIFNKDNPIECGNYNYHSLYSKILLQKYI